MKIMSSVSVSCNHPKPNPISQRKVCAEKKGDKENKKRRETSRRRLLLYAPDAVADVAVNVLRGPRDVVAGGLVHALHGALNGRGDVRADGVLHRRRDVSLGDVLPSGCPAGGVASHGLFGTRSEHHVDGGKGTDASDTKREDLGGLGSGDANRHGNGFVLLWSGD
jgi:hypothetical protein